MLAFVALPDTRGRCHAAGKKKNVNVGSKGGTAGLDDYQYDAPADDDFDFM